jgi:hypothetical protein
MLSGTRAFVRRLEFHARGDSQFEPSSPADEAPTDLNRIASELGSLTTAFDQYVTREIRTQMHSPEEEFRKNERSTTT